MSTVPTTRPDVPHPAWCRGTPGDCDARASYTHRSPVSVVRTGVNTRLEIYLEGGSDESLTGTVLAIEAYTCRCRACQPADMLVLTMREAEAAFSAIGDLLDATKADPEAEK